MAANGQWSEDSLSSGISSLENLPSVAEIREQLLALAGAFGKVNFVTPLPMSNDIDAENYIFLVTFHSPAEAALLSRRWNCSCYGETSVIVPVRKSRAFEEGGNGCQNF